MDTDIEAEKKECRKEGGGFVTTDARRFSQII